MTIEDSFNSAAAYSDSFAGSAFICQTCNNIIYEHYGSGSESTAHTLASGTKMMNIAFYALGVADGLWTLTEKVSDTITEWQGVTQFEDITIENLLAQNGGIVDSGSYSAQTVPDIDIYDLAINDSSLAGPIGDQFWYSPANFHILSALFERKTSLDPVEYLYDNCFYLLGISQSSMDLWTRDVNDKPTLAGGCKLTGREWMAYGQLIKNRGRYGRNQILSPTSIDQCTKYVNTAFRGHGLACWLNVNTGDTYNPAVDSVPNDATGDGTKIASNAPSNMIMAAGTGKNRLYIFPSLNFVVVRMGSYIGVDWSDHTFLGYCLNQTVPVTGDPLALDTSEDGTTVEIVYGDTLTMTTGKTGWTLLVNAAFKGISTVEVAGNTVTITPTTYVIQNGDIVRVSLNNTTSDLYVGAVQAESFTGTLVTNNVP